MNRDRTLTTRVPAILAGAALCAIAACSDAGAPDAADAGAGRLTSSSTSSTPTTGDAVVRGLVVGVDSATGQGERLQPIVGVAITVILVERQPGADSSATPPTYTTVGTVTTAGDGTFELAGVPSGYFFLDAVPPAGSPYRAGRAGSVSFPKGSSDRAIVYLYR